MKSEQEQLKDIDSIIKIDWVFASHWSMKNGNVHYYVERDDIFKVQREKWTPKDKDWDYYIDKDEREFKTEAELKAALIEKYGMRELLEMEAKRVKPEVKPEIRQLSNPHIKTGKWKRKTK